MKSVSGLLLLALVVARTIAIPTGFAGVPLTIVELVDGCATSRVLLLGLVELRAGASVEFVSKDRIDVEGTQFDLVRLP